MANFRSIIRTGTLSFVALMLSLAAPLSALADDSPDCSPPSSSDPGVRQPVGADAGQYHYECTGPNAGKWVSPYYIYDPATYTTTPTYDPDYAYDCDAGQWYKTAWYYSPGAGSYISSRVESGNPGLPTNCPVVAPAASDPGGASSGDPDGYVGASALAGGGGGGNYIGDTGPGSNNSNNNLLSNNVRDNYNSNSVMNNTINGVSNSGNSTVLNNTTAGGATTGNALTAANIINMLQSSSNALGNGSNVITFTKNIDGDVYGDLILDPNQLMAVQPSSSSIDDTGPGSNNSNNTNANNNLTINNSAGSEINNDIHVGATSGNATVSGNTSGGDATTGNADAIANVVNMINTILTSGHSFIGTININGNLNGDILLPDNFVDQLIAANVPTVTITGPSSNNSNNTNVNNNETVTNTNNQGITNKVTTTAATGDANVSGNTEAGGATSGKATTNITAFNLTGSRIIGSNAILVFVNVHGQWVGLIVNAPSGATAAELGGGIVSNTGPNSNNSNNTNQNNNADITNTTNQKINNNIVTDAKSGNANVTGNTKGGNAKTGNAGASVNLLNIEDSVQSLTGWLGILFINVFGTWHGSFGVNTAAGDPIPGSFMSQTASAGGGGGAAPVAQVFRFVPHASAGGTTYEIGPYIYGGGGGSGASDSQHAVLAATTRHNGTPGAAQGQGAHNSSLTSKFAIIGGLTIAYIALDAILTSRSNRRKDHQAQLLKSKLA